MQLGSNVGQKGAPVRGMFRQGPGIRECYTMPGKRRLVGGRFLRACIAINNHLVKACVYRVIGVGKRGDSPTGFGKAML